MVLKINKKAQIWYSDFMVGLLIFIIVVFVYYEFAYNFNEDPGEIIYELMMEAKSISSSLIGEGFPSNWSKDNVKIIGIGDGNHRSVEQKLSMFYDMTYLETRSKLRSIYNYYFHLEYLNGTIIIIDGKNGAGIEPLNQKNLATISRIIIYDSNLARMVVQVWQ